MSTINLSPEHNKLLSYIKDKDIVTYNIISEILTDELDHEQDFQTLQEDMNVMLKRK